MFFCFCAKRKNRKTTENPSHVSYRFPRQELYPCLEDNTSMGELSEANHKGRQYHISGIVQGVGFRPFVYRIATANRLSGDVSNSADGVRIHLFGSPAALAAFDGMLRSAPPPQAKIDQIE